MSTLQGKVIAMILSENNFVPNAVRPKENVVQHAACIRASKIDLAAVNHKLMMDNPEQWTAEAVTHAEHMYRQFLVLHAMYPNEDLVPTKQIDEYWHQHILDTRQYAKDCEFLFGAFLHHDPYFGINGSADRLRNKQAFEWTQALWRSAFGELLLGESNPCKSTDCR